jgi:prolyl-tRNA synthetase
MQKTAISPTRSQDYPQWYQQVIKAADLAEASTVHGCMIIKPWGYGIWENIQKRLDVAFKATGHQNFYFPLFIPVSYLEKEAEHVEGFAKECAVVTHHRLEKDKNGRLKPVSPLEEPLVVRPTSETIIGEAFSRWIQSYRDLPLLMNQWANIVRWEMRTRLFLRTSEFLWQEGHTAHATEQEAREETLKILDVYENFVKNYLAIPVIKGEKTESERFPGAVSTYCIEAMMQDGKALQAGTSHFLGQNFAKAFDIKYLGADGQEEYVWTTSWGVTTRLIGALIMMHSDDDGLILPPKITPSQIVILPLEHKYEKPQEIFDYCYQLADELRKVNYHGYPIQVVVDDGNKRSGDKIWSWIKKGVPVRLEIGPREYRSKSVYMGRRDKPTKDCQSLSVEEFSKNVVNYLDNIQNSLLTRAQKFLDDHSVVVKTEKELYNFFEASTGFAHIYWNGDPLFEKKMKKDLGVTIRCLPLSAEKGKCIFTQQPDSPSAVVAKAY